MSIKDILQTLRSAKRAHVSWVMNADAILHGIPLEEDQVPLNSTECSFGQWYYGTGQCCKELPSFKALEQTHTNLHSTYATIFSAIYQKTDHSYLSGLFGKKRKINKPDLELARSLFPELKKQSDTLVKQLEKLENDIINLPNA